MVRSPLFDYQLVCDYKQVENHWAKAKRSDFWLLQHFELKPRVQIKNFRENVDSVSKMSSHVYGSNIQCRLNSARGQISIGGNQSSGNWCHCWHYIVDSIESEGQLRAVGGTLVVTEKNNIKHYTGFLFFHFTRFIRQAYAPSKSRFTKSCFCSYSVVLYIYNSIYIFSYE